MVLRAPIPMTNETHVQNRNELGNRLDVAERDWIAAHPHRSADEAIYNSKVGAALDAYRKAVFGPIVQIVIPPIENATSLRDLVDKEARQVRECHGRRLQSDFERRNSERRAAKRRARVAGWRAAWQREAELIRKIEGVS